MRYIYSEGICLYAYNSYKADIYQYAASIMSEGQSEREGEGKYEWCMYYTILRQRLMRIYILYSVG